MDSEQKRFLNNCCPSPIDDTIVERIESGDDELTDAYFFELLAESPAYLSQRPFQKRIAEWQGQMDNSLIADGDKRPSIFSETERKAAKLNLLKIGKVLALQQRGRPAKFNDAAIAASFWQCKKTIEMFLWPYNDLRSPARKREFKKCFPYWADAAELSRHRTAQEIAISIIRKKHKISERRLRDIIEAFPS
jgi:hypothetical protein